MDRKLLGKGPVMKAIFTHIFVRGFLIACALTLACTSKTTYGDMLKIRQSEIENAYIIRIVSDVGAVTDKDCEKILTFDVELLLLGGTPASNKLCLTVIDDLPLGTKYALLFDVGLGAKHRQAITSMSRYQTVYPIQHHYAIGVCRDSYVSFRRPGVISGEIVTMDPDKSRKGILGFRYHMGSYWGIIELDDALNVVGENVVMQAMGLEHCHESP